jgi:hypothetical protein
MTQFRDEQSFSVQVLAGYVGWHNRGNAMNWALVHVASNGPFPIRSQYLCLPITPSECIDNGGRRAMGLM